MPWGWRRRSHLLRQEKGVQCRLSGPDGVNVCRSLWGGCELYLTPSVWVEAFRGFGSALGALGDRGGL